MSSSSLPPSTSDDGEYRKRDARDEERADRQQRPEVGAEALEQMLHARRAAALLVPRGGEQTRRRTRASAPSIAYGPTNGNRAQHEQDEEVADDEQQHHPARCRLNISYALRSQTMPWRAG